MTTLLFLHAHPDDESILTGATIAAAKAAGARVVIAFATHGDAGETKADLSGQTLGERREQEARAACDALKVDRVLFLGFADSGMADTETTKDPAAFCNADLEEVTARLSIALVNETIDAVVGYDRNGTYGHPDHIQIHHAAHHAGPALKAGWVLDATYNREYLQSLENQAYGEMGDNFALPEAELTHFVEGFFDEKLGALMNHASQTPDDMDMDDQSTMDGFAQQFGTEWYRAVPVGDANFDELASIFQPKEDWKNPNAS